MNKERSDGERHGRWGYEGEGVTRCQKIHSFFPYHHITVYLHLISPHSLLSFCPYGFHSLQSHEWHETRRARQGVRKERKEDPHVRTVQKNPVLAPCLRAVDPPCPYLFPLAIGPTIRNYILSLSTPTVPSSKRSVHTMRNHITPESFMLIHIPLLMIYHRDTGRISYASIRILYI